MEKQIKQIMRTMLITHGDLDGIISAVCMVRKFELQVLTEDLIFVQPFTVDKVAIPDDMKRIFVVDVAVNNRDPKMTKDFISRIGNRLGAWYDHHEGWTDKIIGGNSAFIINANAGSCAEIIGGDPALVEDATAADTRKGILSSRAQLIEQAMKANMEDDSIRLAAYQALFGDDGAWIQLETAAKKYAEIQAETERLVATYRLIGKVALVDTRKSNHPYDLTQLLLAGQKMAPFAIALTIHQQDDGLTIATSRKDVNLVELFKLGSGAPFRVFLPAKRLKEVLTKLTS